MTPNKPTAILAIETSCDETGIAIVKRQGQSTSVLADAIASQIDIHKETGGVVPEVAAREHASVIQPLIKKVLGESKQNMEQISAIAITVGPGLAPALSIGVTAAQTLAYAWKKPIVPVHHIEGHIYSALLSQTSSTNYSLPTTNWPALALIVSGGHTQLIIVHDHLTYEVIGSTRDDAVGEAFDKVARMLELGYPGGPAISKIATQGKSEAFTFARPMLNSGDFDFSFSGLKTEILYTLRDNPQANPADVAASFQQAAVDTLIEKTKRAAEQLQPKMLLLAGGVAANQLLRQSLAHSAEQMGVPLRVAPQALCGDNAVMIGQVGTYAFEAGRTADWKKIDAHARLDIATMAQYAV